MKIDIKQKKSEYKIPVRISGIDWNKTIRIMGQAAFSPLKEWK